MFEVDPSIVKFVEVGETKLVDGEIDWYKCGSGFEEIC